MKRIGPIVPSSHVTVEAEIPELRHRHAVLRDSTCRPVVTSASTREIQLGLRLEGRA